MACKDCFTGTLRGDVMPQGHEEVVHGLETYVAIPEPGIAPLGTVIIIPDAFGWKLRNMRVLADAYARNVPCVVYVPDVMDGHAPPESLMPRMEYRAPASDIAPLRLAKRLWTLGPAIPTIASFLYNNRSGASWPRIQTFVRAVRTTPPRLPGQTEPVPARLGVAGFCWGGPYAIQLTHNTPETRMDDADKPLVDCAFTAHPSLLSVPSDVEAVVRPLSVANGDDDEWMGRARMAELCAILDKKNSEAGAPVHEAVVYPGARHGFAVRGDREDPLQKERGDQSEQQAVLWFRKHFAP